MTTHRDRQKALETLQRVNLEALASALGTVVAFERHYEWPHIPARGDAIIEGRRGNIHADGTGFSIYITLGSSRKLGPALDKLAGFTRKVQHGDDEAVLHMPTIPNAAGLKILKSVLGRRRRLGATNGAAKTLPASSKPRLKQGFQAEKRVIAAPS